MHIRSLFLLGFCAAIGMSMPAHAEAPAKTYLFPSKAKAEEGDSKQVKKPTAKEKARQKSLAKSTADTKAKKAAQAKEKKEAEVATKRQLTDPASIVLTGNNGELRSETQNGPQGGFLSVLFGGDPSSPRLLPETRALDAVLEQKQSRKQFKVKSDFEPKLVLL